MRAGLLVALVALVACGDVLAQRRRITPPPSDQARATLRFDRPVHWLGENILAHFCVGNGGRDPFTISVGGDYRGASRFLRFKVTVTDDRGRVVPDPDPIPFNLGGLGFSPQIEPGGEWCQSLPLMRYARIDDPGVYTVSVVHDLGWPDGLAPKAQARLTVAMPSASEAEQVVAAMEALPPAENNMGGRVSPPFKDFSSLRYPVYLAPLGRRANSGSIDAVAGIGAVPTVDATRALISLLDREDRTLTRQAAAQLAMRLPDPALSGQLSVRGPFSNELTEPRKYLVSVGWRGELADDVRRAGVRLLASTDSVDVRSGAFFLEAVGRPEERDAVVTALTRAIERTLTEPRETGVRPTPRGAAEELLRAAEILVARGAVPVSPPRAPGEIAFWLVALSRRPSEDGWQQILSSAARHPIAYVRRLAMERLPRDRAAEVAGEIAANLSSDDVDAQIAACITAREAGVTSLGPPAAAALAKATEPFQLDVCWPAALSLGARGVAVDALVSRLADPALGTDALRLLLDLFGPSSGMSGLMFDAKAFAALVPRWRAFVDANRDVIVSGATLTLDDPRVAPDLVPRGLRIRREGKPDWP